MGVDYNKDFITVTTITGTTKVIKVADLDTPSLKSEHFPGVFITSEPKMLITFSHKCTCTLLSNQI
jgi:hypothetical protein